MKDGESLRQPIGGKPSVLIFGVEKDIRFLLRTILEIWNYDSEEVQTVEEAISTAGKRYFDIVLMDTKLAFPDSLLEMRMMRKSALLKDLPFVLLSGHVQSDVRLTALAAGAAELLVKPINLDLLEKNLKTLLAETKPTNRQEYF